MANWQVISLDTTTPQLRAPGTGDGYSFNSGSTQLGVWTTTGLGIGTASPGTKLDVANPTSFTALRLIRTNNNNALSFTVNSAEVLINAAGAGTCSLSFQTESTTRLNIDSSGNLGLGVTPSAWALTGLQAFQVKNGALYGFSGDEVGVTANCFYDTAIGGWKYISTGSNSTRYRQNAGIHSWFTAASGTAGNAITFTQAMTLSAAGGLSVGNTTDPGVYTLSVGPRDTSGNDGVIRIDGGSGASGEAILVLARNGASDVLLISSSTLNEVRGVTNVPLAFRTADTERVRIPAAGGVVVGTGALATNATDGFLYIPGCAGTPTGTPTAYTGRVPLVVDTTNNKLYFYSSGAWRDAGP